MKIGSAGGFSGGREYFGEEGIGNRIFWLNLTQDKGLFFEFLGEADLLKDIECEKCGTKMKTKKCSQTDDGLKRICRNFSGGKQCGSERSFRHGSWFTGSKLKISEIFLMTFEILRGSTTTQIREEYGFSTGALADWRQFIHEALLNHIEVSSEEIGGPGKIVEIDESKFGKRKYNRGKKVDGQWVFGGVERGSGKLFLVAVHNRTQETLLAVIKEWILPGTLIYSDGWSSYKCLGKEGFDHLSVNHRLHFVDPVTNFHTNNS